MSTPIERLFAAGRFGKSASNIQLPSTDYERTMMSANGIRQMVFLSPENVNNMCVLHGIVFWTTKDCGVSGLFGLGKLGDIPKKQETQPPDALHSFISFFLPIMNGYETKGSLRV
ncbi:MAG TPA: hypothetical protein PLR60_15355 [Syntrophorhabdaceae bacterium]|nr:hypothetical protein [Syntrophorhabdaceae bacterium]